MDVMEASSATLRDNHKGARAFHAKSRNIYIDLNASTMLGAFEISSLRGPLG